MPDPKLKEAAAEIKAVLEKYDIAGTVMLSSPTHMEFLHKFQCSWNAFIDNPAGFRFRCKRTDYPTKKAHSEALRVSIGTVQGFADALGQQSKSLQELAIRTGVQFEHMTKDESDRG